MTIASPTFNISAIPGVKQPTLTHSRASAAYEQNAQQIVSSVPADTLRHYWGGNGRYRGWHIEPPAANLLLQTSDLSSNAWAKINCDLASATLGVIRRPDGTLYPPNIIDTAGTSASVHSFRQNVTGTPPVGTYCMSTYALADTISQVYLAHVSTATDGLGGTVTTTASAIFDIATGNPVSTSSEILSTGKELFSNGWARVWATFNMSVPGNFRLGGARAGSNNYIPVAGTGFYVWQPQLVAGPAPGPIMPSGATQATAAQDLLSMDLAGKISNTVQEGVWIVDFTSLSTEASSAQKLISVCDSTRGHRVSLEVAPASTLQILCRVIVGDASIPGLPMTVDTGLPMRASGRVVLSYAPNFVSMAVNGVSSATATPPTMPSNMDTLFIGAAHNSTDALNGAIARITYLPRACTAEEARQLSLV